MARTRVKTAPCTFPVQSQGKSLMNTNVFLFLITVSCKWLSFCMSQLGELGILDAIWIFTFYKRSWVIGMDAKNMIQKLLVECENALERVRENSVGWDFLQNWDCLDYSALVPSQAENTAHCSSLILKSNTRITNWQSKPGKFKLEKGTNS